MMFIQYLLLASWVLIANADEGCPLGGKIYAQGVSSQGQVDLTKAHNDYRKLIMAGEVPGQPKGVGLKTMTYDVHLANEAMFVSDTCKMEHVSAADDRFYVGQNMHITWSGEITDSKACPTNQNWTEAVETWYKEHEDFIYPTGNKPGKTVGRYTQVVWDDTHLVGCDFIAFEDDENPALPCAKLYTCNYGPGGNIKGESPYELA